MGGILLRYVGGRELRNLLLIYVIACDRELAREEFNFRLCLRYGWMELARDMQVGD